MLRHRRGILGASALVLAWLAFSVAFRVGFARPPAPPGLPNRVRGDFRQLLDRDAIRPIYAPNFVPGDRAGLAPGELVIGVEIDGVARAYPVGVLNFREMVDDRIGPVPFLVTW